MEIWHRCSCWPPCRVEARLGSPFDTKEIDAPGLRGIEMLRQTFHRQDELCRPDLAFFIDARAPLQPALQIALFSRRNVQINPEAVGTHLKFLVALPIRAGRL